MRVFGCAAYAHQKNDKLDPRAVRCVFLGYPEGVKGYRLWLKDEPGFKTIISRDVVFNETDFPCLPPVQTIPVDHVPPPPAPIVVEHPYVVSPFDASTSVQTETENVNNHENVQDDSEAINVENEEDETERIEFPEIQNLDDYQLARDRPRREIRRPSRFDDMTSYVFSVFESIDNCYEPATYQAAFRSANSVEWLNAMMDEMNSLHVNQTWTLVPKPKNCSIVDCKWLFKVKNETESLRFKARLVAKGFTQKEGIDYTEIFAPVVKFTTVRVMLALVAQFDWELKQMDVKTAFLHGELDEKIYMRQPEGFVDKKNPDHVCLLKKSLYGLKQSPRMWN